MDVRDRVLELVQAGELPLLRGEKLIGFVILETLGPGLFERSFVRRRCDELLAIGIRAEYAESGELTLWRDL